MGKCLRFVPVVFGGCLRSEDGYLSGVPLELTKAYDYTWNEIGNAMDIASVGTVLCVCLACIDWV